MIPQFFTHMIDSLVSCSGKAHCSFVAYIPLLMLCRKGSAHRPIHAYVRLDLSVQEKTEKLHFLLSTCHSALTERLKSIKGEPFPRKTGGSV